MELLLDKLHLPLHPMMVHFPIALFVSALLFEVLSYLLKKDDLHRTAMHLFFAAALMSILAVLTGLRAEDEAKVHHPVLEIHEEFGLLTMWLSLASLPVLFLINKFMARHFRLAFFLIVALIVGFVSWTAYNGGRLVYEYGVGVSN